MDTYRPAPGTPVAELETPCLLLDLDALEHNYRTIATLYRGDGPKMRQHAKNVKAPIAVQMQIEAGGTVGGVCAAKVSEAEALVEGGIRDVLITSQVVGDEKLQRLCALAKRATVTVSVDDVRQVQALSRAATRQGTDVGVVIEVDTSMGRAGVRAADAAVAIARMASDLPGVVFRGVMSHQTLPGRPDRETRFREGKRFMERCVGVARAIEEAGIPVTVVSSGETWTYDVAPSVPGVTEVEGGTYALMGENYSYMEDFRVAATVLSTVISRPDGHTAIGDAVPAHRGSAGHDGEPVGPVHCRAQGSGGGGLGDSGPGLPPLGRRPRPQPPAAAAS